MTHLLNEITRTHEGDSLVLFSLRRYHNKP